jgi:hypothetical protein
LLGLAVAVALLAWCSVACQSAAAHQFLIEGSPLGAGEVHKVAESTAHGTMTVHAKPFGVNVRITCSKLHVGSKTSQIEAEGKSLGRPEFSECVVSEVVGCGVNEPATAEDKGQLVEVGGQLVEELTPVLGSFSEITLVSLPGKKCSVVGTYRIGGRQLCKLSNIKIEAVEHEASCEVSGSSLEFGGRAATFESTSVPVHLEHDPKWSGV